MNNFLQPVGVVSILLEDGGKSELITFKNKMLRTGRIALCKSVGNSFGGTYEYFVTGMAFGSGGTMNGSIRYIDDARTGLFGPLVTTKTVISTVDPDNPTQVTFTSVLAKTEAVGYVINEMALKMKNGEYLSMATFGDITKTSSQQMTVNWRISFV